jgi:hypothetical protein
MKRLLASSLALIILASASPALAQRHGRDDQYRRWHQGHVRYRHWHGRQVTYWNGRWGYWQPSGGVHVFINVPL